jgi:hypothetical protein
MNKRSTGIDASRSGVPSRGARRLLPFVAAGMILLAPAAARTPSFATVIQAAMPGAVEALCEPPISICSRQVASGGVLSAGQCPDGYHCACVPSCPVCDDCAAEVCVRGGGRSPVRDLDCAERRGQIAERIDHVVSRYGRCRADGACVRVDTSTRCGGTCGAWINRRNTLRMQRAMERLDRRYCGDFLERGCPFLTPMCIAGQAVCIDGRCGSEYVPPEFVQP